MAESPTGPYKVVPLGTLARQLREIATRAEARGLKGPFLATIREVVRLLTLDPAAWGDATSTYQALGLVEYHRLFEMLSIRYAVDETNRVVYLKKCRPVLSHPLAET